MQDLLTDFLMTRKIASSFPAVAGLELSAPTSEQTLR
jgi:hypothetical protein